MATHFHDVTNAIKTMHYRYGIGDVKEVRIFADGRIEVHAKGYSMKPHIRRGRLTGWPNAKQTIRMYGHQMTIMVVKED